MTWVKLDDSFADHPKVMGLGRDRMAGLGVWTAAACYCARHLTDGFVPAAVAEGFGNVRVVRRMVDVGLFDDVPGGYQLHDWLDYNPPRSKVLKNRQDAKDRMNKVRRSGEVRANDERTNAEVPAKFADPVPVPVPEVLENVLSTNVVGLDWIDPVQLYQERTRRRSVGRKERDWIEDLHVRFSRSELVRAMQATDPGPDYLKRVDALLEGAA